MVNLKIPEITPELVASMERISRAIASLTQEERDLLAALVKDPKAGCELMDKIKMYRNSNLGKVLYGT